MVEGAKNCLKYGMIVCVSLQLFVKVNRHRSIRFKYKDEDWKRSGTGMEG